MKLFYWPRTRSSRVVWMLEEIGIGYEIELVNLKSGDQHSENYLQINPLGKVPALVDGDVTLGESGAIMTYLADRYPEAGLAPEISSPLRGRYLQWMFFNSAVLEPAMIEASKGWESDAHSNGWGNKERAITALHRGLEQGPYLLGEAFSAADVLVGSSLDFFVLVGMIDATPSISAYL